MIMHHEKQPNMISDVELDLNTVEALEGVTTLVSDGSYYSKDMALAAEEKGLNLSFSALNGRPIDQEKLSSSQFTINPETELFFLPEWSLACMI